MSNIEHCLREWGDQATKICCLPTGHDGDCYGYPVKSTHGSLLRALRDAREQHRGAVEALRVLDREGLFDHLLGEGVEAGDLAAINPALRTLRAIAREH